MEELEKKIEYQFIPAPLNLFYVCDVYTYSLLLALIQKESYWKLKDKLSSDGYFFMSIEEISDIIYLFDRGDIRCTIEALYINGIIDVKCNGIGRGSKNKIANEFKINYDKIKEFDEMSIFDIKEFNVRIEKLKRGTKVTYDTTCSEEPCKRARKKVNTKSVQDSTQQSTQQSTQDSTQVSTQIASNVATTTIYNIEEKEKIENLNKIDNIDSNISNIVEIEKTVETDDKIEMIDNTSNGTADANTSFNNDNIENKADIPTLNEKEIDSSTDRQSFNEEPKNDTNVDVLNEVADANISFNRNVFEDIETEDKIEMNETVDMLFNDTSTDSNIPNGTADAITSNKAPVSTKNEKTTDTSTDDNLLDTIFADETIEDNDSNSSTYKTENDMMRDEDKKAINEYKIAKKLLTNDERSAILKLIFDNLKTIPKEDANKVLTEYKFSKKEIDYVNECYANQYSYAS
ncbi:hypothetical protein [Bacteroides zhangwenhongii]|jgi:hypothetical protein|uniref:hypothetical protein n=1 Tax=Bacteroides zhangwenhongii TaxID=2650157 RepID=UPI00205A69F1|nr:hypothetical protein [Bacteroides zhangwenhongii]DAT68403.1 MAG TPA: hypothetical protein [Caudoviricetes sp.]